MKATDPFGDRYKSLLGASRAFGLQAGLDLFSRYTGLNAAAEARRLLQSQSMFDKLCGSSSLDKSMYGAIARPQPDFLSRLRLPDPHDQEDFYYDDWPVAQAVKKGALTCDRWRHQSDEESFGFKVEFTVEGEARGTVECTVHAENLTKPEQARVIVCRIIEPLSMIDWAEAMIEACK